MVVAVILMMVGCGSSKEVAYWQNIDSISLAASKGLYDAKIMPKDELTILVQTTDHSLPNHSICVRRDKQTAKTKLPAIWLITTA